MQRLINFWREYDVLIICGGVGVLLFALYIAAFLAQDMACSKHGGVLVQTGTTTVVIYNNNMPSFIIVPTMECSVRY